MGEVSHATGADQRAAGAIISEVVGAAQTAGVDEITLARLRALIIADDPPHTPLTAYGIDSLAWMATLTALENRFGILFSDDFATSPEGYTVMGLARALTACLHDNSAPSL